MSWSWRLNATTWMLNLGAETRNIELSLLGRAVLRSLGSRLRILRRRHLCRSSPPTTNTDLPSLSLVLQRPAYFPSQIPSIPIRRRPLLFMVPFRVRCPASPCCPLRRLYTKNERRRLRKKSRPLREGRIELVDMAGWYSFSDGEGLAGNVRPAMPTDVSFVDELHQRHPVLEPTPPLPTQPLVLTMPSAPVMMASGSTMTMPATPMKGGATLMSRIGSVK